MSDYGSDENPDLNVAQKLIFDQSFLPVDSANVMQWTDDDFLTQKIADKKTHTNVYFKLEK